MNCALLVDEWISGTFLVYKVLRKIKLFNTINIERGSVNSLNFVQNFAKANNNCCPELIVINCKTLGSEGFLFLELLSQQNFSNKEKVKIIAIGSFPETVSIKDVIVIREPVTAEAFLKILDSENRFKIAAA